MSSYTALAVRGSGHRPPYDLRVGTRRAQAGPWLLAEARQALVDLKAEHGAGKALERNLVLGLTLSAGVAHVVPADDLEADLRVNPRFLIDGLGRWPATLCWERDYVPLVIETDETRYWIATVSRPSNTR